MVRTTSAAAVSDLLLDTYTGAAAAYSVRKLDKDYTGYCMKVRRASDDAEADIGFDSNGDLDTAAIAAHCGASAGYVSVWYDQANIGGTPNNATQSTSGSQPQIYNGTAVITENGKPALNFNATPLDLSDFITPSTVTTYSVAGVGRPDANDKGILYLSDGSENLTWHYGRTAGELSTGTYNGTTLVYASGASTINTQFLGFSIHNFTTPQTTLYIDGSLTSGTAAGRGDFDSRIGGGAGTRDLNGALQEIVVWSSNQSSNRTGIESDINTYFSIYT
jgi:hypothetical protein